MSERNGAPAPSETKTIEAKSFWERAFLGALAEEHRWANSRIDRNSDNYFDSSAVSDIAVDVADEALRNWREVWDNPGAGR